MTDKTPADYQRRALSALASAMTAVIDGSDADYSAYFRDEELSTAENEIADALSAVAMLRALTRRAVRAEERAEAEDAA